MPDALAIAVRSTIFGERNIKKAETHHNPVPDLVAVGQGNRVLHSIAKLDGSLGKGARTAVDAMQKISKSDKLIEGAGKVVNFVSEKINPLIVVSAGYDVLQSDDKQSAIITNGTALSSMFAVEHLMKDHLDDIPKMKCMKGITEKVMKFAKENKCEGKLPSIIHGLAFVVGSCTSYSIGDKFGHLLIGQPVSSKQ